MMSDRYTPSPVKTTVEPLEGNKVKLSVEVDEAEFEVALDDAFRRLAREVRIPGFRPGKAPRRVLEARLGPLVARDEALRGALPDYYDQAVREHDVDVIAAPDIDITAGQEAGPVSFDAVVEVRPVIEVAGYQDLRVTVSSPEPTDEEIDEQIEKLRERFSTLEAVDRAAADDDHVTIDISGSQGGEPLDGLSAEDYDYRVGLGAVVPELDENLRGAKAGDILEFDAAHPDESQDDLRFRILVKEVQQRVLPDLDDTFADEASEFATMDEWRADLAQNLRLVKTARGQMALRQATVEALAELVDVEVPDALVSAEAQNQLQELAMQAGAQGLTLEQYLAFSGKAPQDLGDELRDAAQQSARIDLALRAIAEAESIEVGDDELDAEFEEVGRRVSRSVDEVRAEFERGGQLAAVRFDLRKRGALEWLLERVEIVDDDGNPLDRSVFELPDEEPVEPEPDDPDPDDPDPDDEETAEEAP
jgi:trigger factor